MEKKVRVGIVGLGDHCCKSHIQYLIKNELCVVTAICDINPKAVEDICKEFNLTDVKSFNTAEELIKDNTCVDAVMIMTPDKFHLEQLEMCVNHMKHVFCEKPLALNKSEYHRLEIALEKAEKWNLIVTTCHPRRFDTPFEVVRKFISNGHIFGTPLPGKVLNFEFYFHYSQPSKTGLHPSLMYDHLNHEVDAMHYLFGTGHIKHAVKHYDSETSFHVTGLRNDGISFSFIGQRKMDDPETYPEYMKINFEGGSLLIDLYKGEATLLSGKSYTTWYDPAKYKMWRLA